MSQVEQVLSAQNVLGEGPLWHADEGRLYWVDIQSGLFFRWTPPDGEVEQFDVGQPLGCIGFTESGRILLGLRDGLGFWDFSTQAVMMMEDNIAYKPQGRFNDGAVDRQGRFWAGTMSNGPVNHLYRLDADGTVQIKEQNVETSNGIGWSPDNTRMYYSDSGPGVVYAYDFDPNTGEISNRSVLYDSPEPDVKADGLTVDSEGYIWAAFWNGWKVAKIDPTDGNILEEYPVPAQRVTSCAFGGANLDELYITTARVGLSDEELEKQPQAGDVFRLKTGAKGLPEPIARF